MVQNHVHMTIKLHGGQLLIAYLCSHFSPLGDRTQLHLIQHYLTGQFDELEEFKLSSKFVTISSTFDAAV